MLRFFFYCPADPRDLHSFPTRRSSDLDVDPGQRPPRSLIQARMAGPAVRHRAWIDRKSTRLNSSHSSISYAVFCLKKKKEVSFTAAALAADHQAALLAQD